MVKVSVNKDVLHKTDYHIFGCYVHILILSLITLYKIFQRFLTAMVFSVD